MRSILPAIGVAVACAVGLGAQATPPQSQSTQPQSQYPTTPKSKTQKMSSMSSKTVTLTGCLREGDTPGTFVLANVDASKLTGTLGEPHPPTAPPATGTAGSPSAASSDKTNTVELVGSADVNLKPHVGHTVEITGLMVPQGKGKKEKSPTGTTGSAAGETTSETAAREPYKTGDVKNVHRLNVKAIKHVSETCSM